MFSFNPLSITLKNFRTQEAKVKNEGYVRSPARPNPWPSNSYSKELAPPAVLPIREPHTQMLSIHANVRLYRN